MMTFNGFVQEYNLKGKPASSIKKEQVLSSLCLKDVGICLRDGPFLGDIGFVKIHPSKGTHWVC